LETSVSEQLLYKKSKNDEKCSLKYFFKISGNDEKYSLFIFLLCYKFVIVFRQKEYLMNILEKLFSGNSSKKESNEETTETKKCIRCLRRIKISFNSCPHCNSRDFIYDT
jgi:ubiquitin